VEEQKGDLKGQCREMFLPFHRIFFSFFFLDRPDMPKFHLPVTVSGEYAKSALGVFS
jgi:hypothetical protein